MGTYIYKHSREILDHGCFTQLPVRINLKDEIANRASAKFLEKWARVYQDLPEDDQKDSLQSSIATFSGSLASLIFPECQPDRLEVLAYTLEVVARAWNGHRYDVYQVWKVMDRITRSTDPPPEGSSDARLWSLIEEHSNYNLARLRRYIRHFNIAFGESLVRPETHAQRSRPQQLQHYLCEAHLEINQDFGLGLWAAFSIFSQDDNGFDLIKSHQALQLARQCMILVRDYYTWDRDYAQSLKHDNEKPLRNAVSVVMKSDGLSVDDAKKAIRQEIMDKEKSLLKHMGGRQNSCEFSMLAHAVGGFHYWASSCRQYHGWTRDEADTIVLNPTTGTTQTSGSAQDKSCTQVTTSSEEPSSSATAGNHRIAPFRKPRAEALLAPIQYIRSMPTKGVCELATTAFNTWICAPDASVQVIKEVAQHLHDASLMLDDLQDNSSIRRGKPAVHTVFGHAQAIQASSFMVVQASQQARKLQSQRAIDILLEELENIHLGQSLDIHSRFELQCPSEEDYLIMVDNKTGAFFRLIIRLLQAETTDEQAKSLDFERLTTLLGRFYQIRDDYMNLRSSLYADQKGSCEDLDEGKFSYPIVHCLTSSPAHRSHIIGIFRQRPTSLGSNVPPLSPQAKTHILSCLEESGSLNATLELVKQLEGDVKAEVARLEGATGAQNPFLVALLQKLSLADGAS